MYRNSIKSLKNWYLSKNRKPLIIRGPRQVGKSTLVELFARSESVTLLTINLEKNLSLNKTFATLNLDLIIRELEACLGQKLQEPKTLLFLDEIQATPKALLALRYFYEERPDIAIIAAGSLLEFALSDLDFSMPVGRIEYLYLGPMSFKEYLMALKEDYLVELIESCRVETTIPETAHEKLLEKQREFMLVGGMPESILRFTESSSLHDVARVQESIQNTYYEDFAKYTASKDDLLRLQTLFKYIPAHIGQKMKYANISRDDRSRELKKAIQLLSMAGIVVQVFHSSCAGLPLEAGVNQNIYKCLFVDIGLMNRVLGLDFTALRSMNERDLVNEGSLAEQFIGQHLLYKEEGLGKPSLYYWLREGRSGNAEVDFVLSEGNWIVPIEIKAGKTGSLKSLHQFVLHKHPSLALRFDLHPVHFTHLAHKVKTKNGHGTIAYHMLSLPLYLVSELKRLINQIRAD